MKQVTWIALGWAWVTLLAPDVACAQGTDGLAQRIPLSQVARGAGRAQSRDLTLPRRRQGVSGSEFIERVRGLSSSQRETALLAEVERGNVPSFLRRLQPITLRGQGRDGAEHTVVVWVTPDYVAVGSDDDFVRMPMSPDAAQRVADQTGCLLPTRAIVDAVYRQAEVRLAPSPQTPGPGMVRPEAFLAHQQTIERQLEGRHRRLVAGHKKDVVLSTRLAARPDRVAIYGWHRLDGRAIQPLSTVHDQAYMDYSHGIRLVHATAMVDGHPRPLAEVLRDPVLWPLVSDEGPLDPARIP